MDEHGLLLYRSPSLQRLVVTEEKKWGQNSVKFILSYSLKAWQKRRVYERRAKKKSKERRNESDEGYLTMFFPTPLFCQKKKRKMNWRFAKNDLNSGDEEEISQWKPEKSKVS